MQVKEILDAMQSKMIDANKEGRNNIEFPVPKQYTTFPNDHDAELTIIATVLRELKAQDYSVTITDIKHSLLFDIRWLSDLTDAERERMKRLLSEHMVRTKPPAQPVRQQNQPRWAQSQQTQEQRKRITDTASSVAVSYTSDSSSDSEKN
jgi:hypothetical protein